MESFCISIHENLSGDSGAERRGQTDRHSRYMCSFRAQYVKDADYQQRSTVQQMKLDTLG